MNRNPFFKDKVAIVTGSSRGIGKATARLLGRLGASVVLNGRTEETLLNTLEEFRMAGIDSFAVTSDVSEVKGARNLVEQTIGKYGRIDILVNNAGVAYRGLFTETDPSLWTEIFRFNTFSYLYPTRFAIPYL